MGKTNIVMMIDQIIRHIKKNLRVKISEDGKTATLFVDPPFVPTSQLDVEKEKESKDR